MKKKKRIIFLLFALVLTLSIMPFAVAEEATDVEDAHVHGDMCSYNHDAALDGDVDEIIPPDSRVYYATYYATDFATQEEFEASLEAAKNSYYQTNEEFLAANCNAEIGFYSNSSEFEESLAGMAAQSDTDAHVHYATDFATQEEFEASFQNGNCK